MLKNKAEREAYINDASNWKILHEDTESNIRYSKLSIGKLVYLKIDCLIIPMYVAKGEQAIPRWVTISIHQYIERGLEPMPVSKSNIVEQIKNHKAD
ncbi:MULTISPECIES: hypothetical protein [unclassified Breznakia]|uniref:hypothetical protein n=1 Tax=unclassified Breznakia TaxID=2623764 RepID=UPI0024734A61|nr:MULTISPECIES: hypothetical protein [unclassified Breznakia]MDH6367041.1 hypothetical protein [Breznakia sp. PH1-1]MDH6404187.1 hypothetical protein [Breznakia sp. PF1-11]MDH6411928.1 hypothetical protein [Breznakia sp. PFB1-11]MDH6414175.1 hypothetical protein [Breznakia sp. PFB1-14]MDH6418928.1 hypothetical protein [Breznakia sp. PFB1-12]